MTIKSVRLMVKELTNFRDAHHESRLMEGIENIRTRSYERSIVSLRMAKNRIASIINDVEYDWILYEMLIQHKRSLND